VSTISPTFRKRPSSHIKTNQKQELCQKQHNYPPKQ
jgi:hypothetical protein